MSSFQGLWEAIEGFVGEGRVTGSDLRFENTLVAGMKWIGEDDNDEGWSIGKTFIVTQKGSDGTLY